MPQRTSSYLSSLVLALPLALILSGSVRAEDSDVAPDGPWISALSWLSDSELVGTNSQGLLLRPAKLVKVSADALDAMETIGESETSLWSVLPAGEGKVVATDYKGNIHLFSNGKSESIETESRWIRTLEQSPDQDQILAGTEDGKLVVLSLKDKKEIKRVDAHAAAIFDIAFNSTGDQIATCGGDGSIRIATWPELKEIATMSRGNEAVWSVVYSENDEHLISGGADRRIQLWDVANAKSICTIAKAGDWVTQIARLPKSSVVVAGCMNGELVIVDHASMQKVTSVEAAESAIWTVALSGDASQVAVGTRKSGIALVPTKGWKNQAKRVANQVAKVRPPAPK